MNESTTSETSHIRLTQKLLHALWREQPAAMRRRVVLSIIFLFIGKLATIAVPFFLKEAVDILSAPASSSQAWLPLGMVIAYGAARLSTQLFNELRDLCFVRVSQGTQRAILVGTFKHLHRLSLRFHLSRQTGAVSRIIERGARGMQFTFQFMTFNVLPTVVEIALVTVILLVHFTPSFAALTMGTVVMYITYTLIVTEKRTPYRRQMNKEDATANNAMVESLLNYETVKYFGNEEHEATVYREFLERYEAAAVKSQHLAATLNAGQAGIIALGLISVMGLAARGVQIGTLTVGDFVLVNTFLIQLYLPLNLLGFVYREIKQGLIDLDKVFELTEIQPEIGDPETPTALPHIAGKLCFEHVSFHYESRRPILRDISFTVAPGQTVAIVGPSGSGKSTLARLLFRFFDVEDGRITLDDVDIRDLSQETLRGALGCVPQDTVLFNRSIKYNIGYGRLGASDKEIERAAELAQIHEFITSLPDGYQTLVGERGLKLSGGEKQRVALARMILKGPQILILDEATSALDSHTEEAIQSALKQATENRTAVVIAHRLSTIAHADVIIVLRKGCIVERGTHQELLRLDGVYKALWERQAARLD